MLVAFNVPADVDVAASEPNVPVLDTLSVLLARSMKYPVAPVKPPWE